MTFRQSFAWWSFTLGRTVEPVAFLCAAAAAGVEGVEMLPEALWPAARDLGLELVTMTPHESIAVGFNERAHHGLLTDHVRRGIDVAHRNGVHGLIVFAGNRDGRNDEDGIAATVDGLTPVAADAAGAGVVLLLELLNSTVDHPDYQCDRSAWGFEVVRRVDSPGLRVLYDAYHMQVMEGDLLRTMTNNLDLIGHVHTGGVPGRRDLDDRQEVNWRAIGGMLAYRGYDRWIGHEFIPRQDPIDALAHAYAELRAATPSEATTP